MTNFESAFKYTLLNEGGYSNDANDAGGPTKWGITQGDLARWRRAPVSAQDVQNLSVDEAEKIYEAYYWMPLGLDGIKNVSVATAIFDIGVNRGITAAAKYAQAVAGVTQDGHIGPISIAAINTCDPVRFIDAFAWMVATGYAAIVAHNPTQVVFLVDWIARAKRLGTLI